MPKPFEMQSDVRAPWRRYIDELAPVRPDLFAHCHRLTGNLWDAEDLVQDCLLKVFGQLGKTDADILNPKAYLIRTATNLWIDRTRRLALEIHVTTPKEHPPTEQSAEAADAAATLFELLPPAERAALVFKDVLGYSLNDIAQALNTTVGAVKSALHRARARAANDHPPANNAAPEADLVTAFMQALSRADTDALKKMCAADLRVELVGGAQMANFEESESFFAHAHFVMPEWGFGADPHWRLADYANERIVIGYRTLEDVVGINEVHRLQTVNGKIVGIRCYCFCPDTLAALAAERGEQALARPYRSPSPEDFA